MGVHGVDDISVTAAHDAVGNRRPFANGVTGVTRAFYDGYRTECDVAVPGL